MGEAETVPTVLKPFLYNVFYYTPITPSSSRANFTGTGGKRLYCRLHRMFYLRVEPMGQACRAGRFSGIFWPPPRGAVPFFNGPQKRIPDDHQASGRARSAVSLATKCPFARPHATQNRKTSPVPAIAANPMNRTFVKRQLARY